jgi:hypothetical protein
MKLETYIGSNCHGGHCPTVYQSDRGTFIVQGNLLNPSEISDLAIPPHEGVVEIPESLVEALASKFANR